MIRILVGNVVRVFGDFTKHLEFIVIFKLSGAISKQFRKHFYFFIIRNSASKFSKSVNNTIPNNRYHVLKNHSHLRYRSSVKRIQR